MIGNRFDLIGGLQHPAFAPAVDDAVIGGSVGEKRQRDLEDDGVDVAPGLRVFAAIYETVIALLVLFEFVAVPGQRAGGQVLLHAVSPVGQLGVVVEKVVAFEFQQRLGNLE